MSCVSGASLLHDGQVEIRPPGISPAETGILSSLTTSAGLRRSRTGHRTDDLLLAKQALSQLSYGPVSTLSATFQAIFGPGKIQPPGYGLEDFELSTSGLIRALNQLSYRPVTRRRPKKERETKAGDPANATLSFSKRNPVFPGESREFPGKMPGNHVSSCVS